MNGNRKKPRKAAENGVFRNDPGMPERQE